MPTSMLAAHSAVAPTQLLALPTTRLTVGSNDVPGVTATVRRSPAGTDTRYMRSMPCVPRQLFAVLDVKSFAYPVSVWFTDEGSDSSGADAHVSPTRPPPLQLPKEQVCAPEHMTHALPLAPHAEFEVPLMHVSPWQQPLGHVDALQVAMHDVPLQTCEPLHVAHALPLVPHAPDVVPGMHTLP